MTFNYTYPGLAISPFPFKDKKTNIKMYVAYMLSRTQSMFEYTGLPESIPQRILELYLQTNGNVCITHIDGNLRVFTGGLGGEPDIYYMPTRYIVANPRLSKSLNLEIGEDCIVIPNDSMYLGLKPMFERYATALAENDLSMRIVDINARIASLISSGDDNAQKSAQRYLQQIEDGELGVIADSAFLDGIKAQPYSNTGAAQLTDLIEYQQYLRAGWFNDLGLQANYNMKRESINSDEAQLNEDMLLPFVDDMLRQRQIGVEAVNDMYGTDISVDFASSWKNNEREIEATLEAEEQAAEDPEPDAVDNPVDEVENDGQDTAD